MKKIVIVNKFRFITFLLITFLLLSFLGYSFLNIGRVYSKDRVEFTTYIVDNGETLWDVASKNNPDKKDVREVIYEIKKINNITETITVGQELKIPV